jgi:hypothetical protein
MPSPQALDLAWRDAWAPRLRALHAGQGASTLADVSADNLYLFRDAHNYRFVPGDWPVVIGRTYDGTDHAIPLFDVCQAPTQVLAGLLRQHACLYPLSQAQQQQWAQVHPGLAVQWDTVRDDADYVYTGESFRTYAGLHAKRNLVKQLLAAHVVRWEVYTPAQRPAALTVLQGWMKDKQKAPGDADDAPCQEALQWAPAWGWQGMLFWVNDVLAGFVLAEALQPEVWAMRFAKARTAFKGLPQFMFQCFCQEDATRKVHWLNFEQDLGLARFRQTKMSYRPAHLLGKYRVKFPLDTPNG